VPMTKARVLRSRVKRKFHARFCTGSGAGDRPTDQSEPDHAIESPFEAVFGFVALQAKLGHTASAVWRLMRHPLGRPA
jgi:hypothetical protein